MSTGAIPLPQAIRERLESTLGPVFYSDFSAMLKRDAVFVVHRRVALVDCAVAVAMDDDRTVAGWIADGTLRKPSRAERDEWPTQEGRRWSSVVVQPFVLLQDEEPLKSRR
jgi:hypothetical protein